jgi:hypothetical protein
MQKCVDLGGSARLRRVGSELSEERPRAEAAGNEWGGNSLQTKAHITITVTCASSRQHSAFFPLPACAA